MAPLSVSNPLEGNNAQSLFVPPSGGDIILRSSDGVDFLVHSTHLKLASSVFADMISTSTQKDTVQLSEDATGVSYLLRFIYPNSFPLTISPDALFVCLTVVQKYDVGGAINTIDELITLDTLPHKLLSSNPVRAHQLATQFNLAKTKLAAAPLITPDLVDFCDLDKVSELAQKYSSRRLINLMNIQAMRAKILSDVLFSFDQAPVQPAADNRDLYFDLSCERCQSPNRDRVQLCQKVPPSWVLAWARFVYKALLTSPKPLAQLRLFQSSVLEQLEGQDDVCQECLADFQLHSSQGPKFDHWAQTIKEVLETQLGKLELVYAL